MEWKRDEPLEAFLDSYEVPWRYETIRFDDIEMDQGRLTVRDVDEDLQLDYAMKMERGAIFPAPCAMQIGKKLILGQGRHRVGAAALNGETKSMCLIATPATPEQEWAIKAFGNQIHGLRLSKSEQIQVAIETLRRFPHLTRKSVAEQIGLKASTLANAINAEKTRRTVKAAGIRKADSLPQKVLVKLHALRRSEPVMVEAAKAIADGHVSHNAAAEFVAAVNRQNNDKARLRAIEHYKHNAKSKAATQTPLKTKSSLPRDELTRILGKLQSLISLHSTAADLCLHTPHLRREATSTWRRVREMVDEALEVT